MRKTGNLLKEKGYEVIVFDLINPAVSFCYNPFVYVHDDREVLTLIENLIQNTTPSHSKSSDPFWEKSETALLQALMLYLLHEAPPEEQNFSMVMEMIAAAEVHEDDDNYQSPLDILFERLEMREPDSIACKQYRIFKQAAGKTAKSILVSVGVRLAAFNLPSIAKLTMTDELHLQELGERKVALFCCIPDSDKSLNYLVGMIYTQLIQTLYRQADRVHKGRLPVPVHCLMDEYANISLPKDTFLSALATMRSRAIFCSIIVQNMAQLKAMYKDDWESLVGLCDEFLYLGGTEKETHKYVSELLGKETISTTSYNQSKGRSGNYSINRQQSGRDLMTPDEVRLLDNSKCILNAAHDSFPTFLPRQQQGDLHNQHPWHRFAAPAQPVAQRFLSYHKISKTTIEETANLKRAKKAHGEPQIMADGGWRFVAGWSQSKSPKLICPSVLWRSSSGGGAASRCRADSASVSQGRIWSRRRISGIRSWMPCIEALGVVVRITNRLAPSTLSYRPAR